MDITTLISSFQNWLKTLTDGEATFYGMVLSAVLTLCIWFIRHMMKHYQNPAGDNTDNKAAQIQPAQPDQSKINIKIAKVSAKNKGIAIGVNMGSDTIKAKEQEQQNGD